MKGTGLSRKAIALFLTFALVFSFSFQIGGAQQAYAAAKSGKKVTSIAVTNLPSNCLTLKKGASKKLKVQVTATGGASKKVTYKSSNKKVVTVSKKGVLKAKKKGKATITIRSKAKPYKKKKIKVTVGVPVGSIALPYESYECYENTQFSLSVSISPSNASNKTVIWTSSDPAVAEVSSAGAVKAKKKGTAKITAIAADGSGKADALTLYVYSDDYDDDYDDDGIDNLDDDYIDMGDIEEKLESGELDITYNDDGMVGTLDGQFTDKKVTSEYEAAEVLSSAEGLFVKGTDEDDSYFDIRTDDITKASADATDSSSGEDFYRYSPVVNGIGVMGGGIILATDQDGNVTGLTNNYDDSVWRMDTDPEITGDEAIDSAWNYFLNSQPDTQLNKDSFGFTATPLIYNTDPDKDPVLAYQVKIDSAYEEEEEEEAVDEESVMELPGSVVFIPDDSEDEEYEDDGKSFISMTYYICARGNNDYETGEVIEVIDTILGDKWENYTATLKDHKNVDRTVNIQGKEAENKYRFVDKIRNIEIRHKLVGELPAPIVEAFFNGLGEFRYDKSAVSTLANMSQVYDYYKDYLKRKSYDDKGSLIKVTYGWKPLAHNALWSNDTKQFIFLGGHFQDELDAVAHEYTHAVGSSVIRNYFDDKDNNRCILIEGLVYHDEPGALNESLSDIMGELIEAHYTGSYNWIHNLNGDKRNFKNPAQSDQPAHYDNFVVPPKDENGRRKDNGGVHINSGIFNHAAYLMITNGKTSGLSCDDWAEIFYRSMFRLNVGSNFLDARRAVIASAKALGYGDEVTSAIEEAFDSTGIIENKAVRLVLRWGNTPRDLDSHFSGPSGDDTFHIYYSDPVFYKDAASESKGKCVAYLSYDDTDGRGPEVITLFDKNPGTYKYAVHNFTDGDRPGSTTLVASGANVKVYNGKQKLADMKIPTSGAGIWWNVLKLNISADKKITVQRVNTITSSME